MDIYSPNYSFPLIRTITVMNIIHQMERAQQYL